MEERARTPSSFVTDKLTDPDFKNQLDESQEAITAFRNYVQQAIMKEEQQDLTADFAPSSNKTSSLSVLLMQENKKARATELGNLPKLEDHPLLYEKANITQSRLVSC